MVDMIDGLIPCSSASEKIFRDVSAKDILTRLECLELLQVFSQILVLFETKSELWEKSYSIADLIEEYPFPKNYLSLINLPKAQKEALFFSNFCYADYWDLLHWLTRDF